MTIKPEYDPNPDIYYIVLDGYGRADYLDSIYEIDNSAIVSALEDYGFYVAQSSRSNYIQSVLSISSSLNLDYISSLPNIGAHSIPRSHLKELIQQNRLIAELRRFGYQFITFDTGYFYTDIQDSDVYFTRYWNLSEFEEILLGTTVAVIVDEFFETRIPFYDYGTHRARIRFILDTLRDMPEFDEPVFVFAHIFLPHPPFVFDTVGNPVSEPWPFTNQDANLYPGTYRDYMIGYRDQIAYINTEIITIVKQLLRDPDNPPIIIIQGDHGSRMLINWQNPAENCLIDAISILNAYYLPEDGNSLLYPTITPVNTFRIILNTYFDANLEILDDVSYYPNFEYPYNFTDVTGARIDDCSLPQDIK